MKNNKEINENEDSEQTVCGEIRERVEQMVTVSKDIKKFVLDDSNKISKAASSYILDKVSVMEEIISKLIAERAEARGRAEECRALVKLMAVMSNVTNTSVPQASVSSKVVQPVKQKVEVKTFAVAVESDKGEKVEEIMKKVDEMSRDLKTVRVRTANPPPHRCPKCGNGCETNGGLQKHMKLCGTRDTTKCQLCERTFPTFQGVRQREKKAHPDLYAKEMENSLPRPEHELLETLADIEVSTLKGKPFPRGKQKLVPMAPRAATTTPGTGCEELDDSVYGIPRSSLDPIEVPAVLPIASSPGIHSSQIPGASTGRIPWAAPVNDSDSDDSLNEPPPNGAKIKKTCTARGYPITGGTCAPKKTTNRVLDDSRSRTLPNSTRSSSVE
ncbi:unnamed protein product [Phaedon cochleariae]|uniref:C2H2-type domain-containing protein n=1 Tax=Phaedon cochleariae TaxID=80249 RepID=A0A9N9SN39_PHACE|nr:unnamed protein product [Phaedon cochleariae]